MIIQVIYPLRCIFACHIFFREYHDVSLTDLRSLSCSDEDCRRVVVECHSTEIQPAEEVNLSGALL